MADFTPAYRQKFSDVEAMQVKFENIEEVADFIGSPLISLTNPSGDGMVVIYHVNGDEMAVKFDWWFVKNEEGTIARLSPLEFLGLYDPILKEIES